MAANSYDVGHPVMALITSDYMKNGKPYPCKGAIGKIVGSENSGSSQDYYVKFEGVEDEWTFTSKQLMPIETEYLWHYNRNLQSDLNTTQERIAALEAENARLTKALDDVRTKLQTPMDWNLYTGDRVNILMLEEAEAIQIIDEALQPAKEQS